MKELKWIMSGCKGSLELLSTVLAFVAVSAVMPVVLWNNHGWCAGVLSIVCELLILASVCKVFRQLETKKK